MDLDFFYSDDIKIWETVLGKKMHYHYAVSSDVNDPFDQAVLNLFPYLQNKTKILDCGCGWGGPGNLIREKLNCEVTGVTISKTQSEYIESFPVIHQDLNEFTPSEKYDVALFMESFTHITDSAAMLKRFYNNVDSVLIKDYVSPSEQTIPDWGMLIRRKETFIEELETAGYVVRDYYEIEDFFQPAVDLWEKNLARLDRSAIRGHIKHLYDLCIWYKHRRHWIPPMNQCVVFATK